MKAKGGSDTLRREVLGKVVRDLRDHLKKSQDEFADLIGGKTNFVHVSRWERAKFAPTEWRCRKLAEIADKAGRPDLAGVFRFGPDQWSFPVLNSDRDRTLVLLQIGATTLLDPGVKGYRFDEIFSTILNNAASGIEDYLIKRFLYKGIPPVLSNGRQCKLWFAIVAEFKAMDEYLRGTGKPGYCEVPDDKEIFGPAGQTPSDIRSKQYGKKADGKKTQKRR
jgi:hypothetical protein